MGTEERQSFVARHRASMVVLVSQISAAFVHGVVKALESGEEPVGPFQILFVRMSITGVGCSLYLWVRKNQEFPLGQREARPLLLLRAVGGILGAGGMYCGSTLLSSAMVNSGDQCRRMITDIMAWQTRSRISLSLKQRH